VTIFNSTMTTPTDYRALCAELIEIIEEHCNPDEYALLDVVNVLSRARTLLSQPEPEGPTLDCDEIDVPAWYRGDDVHVYEEGYTAGWAAGTQAMARPTP
jgi:hypothetical protein